MLGCQLVGCKGGTARIAKRQQADASSSLKAASWWRLPTRVYLISPFFFLQAGLAFNDTK